MKVRGMKVRVMLSCTHILTLTIESMIFRPVKGQTVKCSTCNKVEQITQVGNPFEDKKNEKNPMEDN
jgi:hypothetical protein